MTVVALTSSVPPGLPTAKRRTLNRVLFFLASLLLLPSLSLGQTFVQVNNNTNDTSAATVDVTYATPETAGNTNIVVVGWADTSSSVISVVDDNTNTYVLVGTTAGQGITQAIYYARNIVLPTNTTPKVTVTFNQTAGFPDVRILEYSGLSATAPLDTWGGGSGLSALADSGGITTSATDLILGAGTTASAFTAAGTGFTLRTITTPFGDIVEDSNTALPAGAHNATAAIGASREWVMQVAGFSATPVTLPGPPVISPTTPITPAAGSDVGGTPVTITGTGFQPGAVVLFGTPPAAISALNCVESAGTTITCLTPGGTDGAKDVTVVNVDGQASTAASAYTFQNVTPVITSISPAAGPTNGGTAVTLAGSNFQGGAKVLIGGLPASDVIVQSSTSITASTPGLPVGPANVTVNNPGGGTVTNTNGFTYALGTGLVNYIQIGGAATGGAAASVVGPMPVPQGAGHLNVVIIGWADTAASVASVVDTEGNTYVAALPATTGTGLTQAIYYAKNIVGDTGAPNQATVTFNQVAQFPDVQILEYSGLDITSPIDAAAGNSGTGFLADTGACTTTSPVDLIISGSTVGTSIGGSGVGFNLLNITPDGGNAQHQITSVAGSCQATSPLNSSASWVTQTVAFKAAPAPVPDFTVTATPASQTVIAGNAGAYTVTVTATNGFNSTVTLTCAAVSLPAGASCAFSPSSVTPGASPATSALSISTASTTPAATSTITVTGTSGSLTHNASVGLTVTAPADFTVAATALAPASVAAGGTATSTVTVAALNGFNTAVSLSCTVAPAVTPAPTCAFVPPSIPTGAGTSALTVSTSATTPPGAYVVTVTGAGGVNHSTTLNLTVTAAAAADFGITASALSPAAVTAGGTATSTITIAPTNGFNGTVNLTCAVTPVVARPPTCTLNPAAISNGTGTAVLTVKTTAATTASLAPQSRGIFFATWLPIGGLALLGTGITSRKKKLLGFLLGCAVFSGLIFLGACGGSSSGGGGGGTAGTPTGAYTVTITGKGPSGSPSHSTTATFNVH
jgi:IPT/TIG domain